MTEPKDAFGWNDSVDVPKQEYVLLPEGEAFFSITALDRKRKEFGKFGVVNVAIVTFLCSPIESEQKAEIEAQFALHRALGWKILQLATSCGFRKPGDGNQIDPRWWEQLIGAVGFCRIAHRSFPSKRDGKEITVNEIAEFLAPKDGGGGEPDNLKF